MKIPKIIFQAGKDKKFNDTIQYYNSNNMDVVSHDETKEADALTHTTEADALARTTEADTKKVKKQKTERLELIEKFYDTASKIKFGESSEVIEEAKKESRSKANQRDQYEMLKKLFFQNLLKYAIIITCFGIFAFGVIKIGPEILKHMNGFIIKLFIGSNSK